MEEEDEYSAAELLALKKLKMEARALENFTGTVCGLRSYSSSITDFNLANGRVGASVSKVVNGEFCTDVISVPIGEKLNPFALPTHPPSNKKSFSLLRNLM